MAKLYFRYGAMNSGKTTALIQVAHNYEERGMNVFILKPAMDTKGNDKIISRLGICKKVDCLISKVDKIEELLQKKLKKSKISCILVDEVQFMTKEQIDELFYISITLNIPIICYGIRTDFLMNGFEGSERLLLIAHSIEELKTICRCGNKAMVNCRKINGKFVFEGDQYAIDGEQNVEYESICGKCFINEKRK